MNRFLTYLYQKRRHPILWLSFSVFISCLSLTYLANIYAKLLLENQEKSHRNIKIEQIKGDILRLDEVLTSSALLYAKTKETQWLERYKTHSSNLDDLIKHSQKLTPKYLLGYGAEMTKRSNEQLISYENQSFKFAQQGNLQQAWETLTDGTYQKQKNIYALGMVRFSSTTVKLERIAQLAATIQLLDEVLSMSAMLFSVTGDISWELRFNKAVFKLDSAIQETLHLINNPDLKRALTITDHANVKLIQMERKAFELGKKNKLNIAYQILQSKEYKKQKEDYSKGMSLFLKTLSTLIDSTKQLNQQELNYKIIFTILAITFLIISLVIVLVSVRAWQKELVQKNKKLTELNEELEQFAYRSSHDLKAPLTTIKGLTQYIDQDINNGNIKEASANIKKVFNHVSKLEKLIVQILDLARADLGTEKKEIVEMKEILGQIEEKFHYFISEKKINFYYQINLSEPILIQKTRIVQILENLVLNSIKYCDPNKVEKFIKIEIYDDPTTYFLSIEDNGLGIPKNQESEIFKMFKRFHYKSTEGAGIGLFIIKKHVNRLNGIIKLKSLNYGSLFKIEIPKDK